MNRLVNLSFLAFISTVLLGCATVETPNPKDPFQGFNRAMYSFNDGLDAVALKPVAKAYAAVMPEPARECVSNVFDNLKVPFSALNNLLQGKPVEACEDMARFVVNSTFGLAGCFDIATRAGIPNHREDFGQTLGRWGVPTGPYLVLPLFGPSTVRDATAQLTPLEPDLVRTKIDHVPTRNTALGVRLVDFRAGLLKTTNALDEMDVDKYNFVRDAYLSRRQKAVYDGDPPDEDEEFGKANAGKALPPPTGQDLKQGAEIVKDSVKSIFSTILNFFR